jgi:chromosomal replication initiation ATPase DnaA
MKQTCSTAGTARRKAARRLLLVGGAGGMGIALPDLASRLGAALHLDIGVPDDAMLADLILAHAEARGLALGPDAAAYLVPRCERSHLAVERLVAAIDRLSLERKAPPGMAIWRAALDELNGESQPRLL